MAFIFDAEMKYPPLSLRNAVKKRGVVKRWRLRVHESTSGCRDATIDVTTRLQNVDARKSANAKDELPAGFVQRRRAGYDTAAATGLQRNNTVTRPLGHMITESDVPDYAELQRHSGHRESSMHAEAAEAKSVTRMKPGSGATDALLGQQDLVALSSAVGDHEATNVEDKLAEASRPRNFNLEYKIASDVELMMRFLEVYKISRLGLYW